MFRPLYPTEIVLVTYCLESLVDPISGVVVVEKCGCEYVLALS